MQPHLTLSRSRNVLSTIKLLPVDLISRCHLAATSNGHQLKLYISIYIYTYTYKYKN